jgi:hypothetical protein
MTGWVRAWRHVTKPSKRRGKAYLKQSNHRANRRAGKRLEDQQIKLSGWDVT